MQFIGQGSRITNSKGPKERDAGAVHAQAHCHTYRPAASECCPHAVLCAVWQPCSADGGKVGAAVVWAQLQRSPFGLRSKL